MLKNIYTKGLMQSFSRVSTVLLAHRGEFSLLSTALPTAPHPTSNQRRYSRLYEPDYLESAQSKIPLYDTLNIQIKGYDFTVLENYQKYIHNMARNMGIEVEDCWACPPAKYKIQKYKPASTVVDAEYKLCSYERNVQISDVPSTLYSVLLSVLTASLPEGVKLKVHEHLLEHEDNRYVPDLQLKELKSQLDVMGGPSKQKK